MAVSYQKDASARLLKSYPPPFQGTWKTLPAHLLPDTALQDSSNVTILNGTLRSRCGLSSFSTQNLGNRVQGSFLTVDTTNTKYPLCSTKNKVYKYSSSTWN